MSCIVLDIELADRNVIKELGVFIDTHFVLQKRTNPQNKRFDAQETCRKLCETVDVWITVSLQYLFLEQ